MRNVRVSRRDALFTTVAAFSAVACGESCSKNPLASTPVFEIPSSAIAREDAGVPLRGQVRLRSWQFNARPGTAESAAATAIVPAWGGPGEKYPLLIALHGRGEAMKPPLEGSMGWPRDYALVRAVSRLCNPPLTALDFETFVEAPHLADANRALGVLPFQGLVVLCPHLPDVDTRDPKRIDEFTSFLFREVVPRAVRELPVLDDPKRTGIDGVSLGGAAALWTGLRSPERFGTVGTLQPAIGEGDAPAIADALAKARDKNPKLAFRLLTSDGDYFRGAVEAADKALQARGLAHDFAVVPGPHDYPFNRGPGALEMLLWHDRLLRS